MPDAFFGTIIYENKTPDKSCVIIRSFLRDPSKLPNYLLLRRGQPCQSTGPLPLSLSLLPLLPPSPPHLQTRPTQHLMALRSLRSRSDDAALTNKGSFTLDELIKRQVGSKTCFFFLLPSRKTLGQVRCKESVGEKLLDRQKRKIFAFSRGLA